MLGFGLAGASRHGETNGDAQNDERAKGNQMRYHTAAKGEVMDGGEVFSGGGVRSTAK